jgi:hypothetical protein
MPISFDVDFDDYELLIKTLDYEIKSLKQFVTPDSDTLDGNNIVDLQIEREKASIDELTEILAERSYINSKHSKDKNNKARDELVKAIQEHIKDVNKFEADRIEIPKEIQRLERIKHADKHEYSVFKLSHDTPREEIKKISKEIQLRLERQISSNEKRILTYIYGHLESAKTILDSGKELSNIYFYLHQNEYKYLANIKSLQQANKMIAINLLEKIYHLLLNNYYNLLIK